MFLIVITIINDMLAIWTTRVCCVHAEAVFLMMPRSINAAS